VLAGCGARFGFEFLEKVYLVGGMFEVMQSWCNHKSHLAWQTLSIDERPELNQIKGVAAPVLNPGHRNVLEADDGADLLLTVGELDQALESVKNKRVVQDRAHSDNEKYRQYGADCLAELVANRQGATNELAE
jgi:hypothetical protein